MTCACTKLAALPAVCLTAIALTLGVAALANGSVLSPVAEMPRKADAQVLAGDDLAPTTTGRDWTEAAGSARVRSFR